MSPNVQFIPRSAPAGLQLIGNGNLVATLRTDRFNLSNHVLSGSAASDFVLYTFSPLRKSTTYIEYIFRVNTSGEFVNAGDFQARATVTTQTITIGNTIFLGTPSIVGSGLSLVLRARFTASSSYVNSYWAGVSAGDHLHFQMSYTI